jgi:hypothetical protein
VGVERRSLVEDRRSLTGIVSAVVPTLGGVLYRYRCWRGKGIDVLLATPCVAVDGQDCAIRVACEGVETTEVTGTHLLIATGRNPNTDDLGIKHLGVNLDGRGFVPVDGHLRTDDMFEGDAFVAMFGDVTPITTRQATPVGFKVARVGMARGEVVDFAVNRIAGANSKLHHHGFERPTNCVFGPDGALYVTDFWVISIALEKGGVRLKAGTGTLWRIRRTGDTAGEVPRPPVELPTYAAKATIAALVVAAAAAAAIAWAR